MAKYRYGDLHAVEYSPSGSDLTVDSVVVLGGVSGETCTVGVALKTVTDGTTEEGAVAVSGVFELPKVSGAVITAGQSVNWDASEGGVEDNAHTAASGDVVNFGKAMQDGANGETTILVDIRYPGTFT